MRILVTWGSKRGGTEGIAWTIAEALRAAGHDVEALPARRADRARDFDAAIIGGALYAFHWHPAARHFVRRNLERLRRVPVWFFSSGPLDDSADRTEIPPTPRVTALMNAVGAQGHVTFGGRLEADARGFPASAMAKQRAGDFRNPDRIRRWAAELDRALVEARPRPFEPLPGGSLLRLAAHAAVGWAACAATMGTLLAITTLGRALLLHTVAAPLLFVPIARHYFRALGAREPLGSALSFAGIVALLDLAIVAGLVQHRLAMFTSFTGTWLPLLLIFLSSWATGEVTILQGEGVVAHPDGAGSPRGPLAGSAG